MSSFLQKLPCCCSLLKKNSKNLNLFRSLASDSSKPKTSALRYHQRMPGGQKQKIQQQIGPDLKDRWSVIGYSTANQYNLLSLAEKLEQQGIYEIKPLVQELVPSCIYVKSKYKLEEENGSPNSGKDIFFFENGSVIFWNVPELERDNVIHFIKCVESEGLNDETIHEESEMMTYKFIDNNNSENNSTTNGSMRTKSQLSQSGTILLNAEPGYSELKRNLEKYAFSNGMAASVKLGTLESSLDRIIDSIEHISEDMKKGSSVKLSRQEVLQKTGEIFTLRHVLNLSSDLLDTPDFYWDREELEHLYHGICAHLTIAKRTRVMNEKLTHCCELMELITSHLNDEHHVRLEWFIIILIMIEVGFELLHFAEKFV